jgi:DNA helicase-2/ATP-dependent DNA helicase PcrA
MDLRRGQPGMSSVEQRRTCAIRQQDRVVQVQAPVYVQACPGAGKTRVIVERHLTQPLAAVRRGRAVLSFTNVACAEIRQRCSERNGPDMLRFPHFVGTIDTFFWRYLLRPFIEPNRRRHRIDSWDRVNAVVTISAQPYDHKIRLSDFQFRHDLDTGTCTAQLQASNRVWAVLTRLRNEGLLQQAEDKAVELRTAYAHNHGYVTGHEIRVLALHYLRTRRPTVISMLRTRFDEIIIDEAQDCSALDLAILGDLHNADIPLAFIGDPDQAIYEFRGADPDSVRAFGALLNHTIELTGNWRSTTAICRTAATLRPTRFARPADDAIGDHHDDTTPVLFLPANGAGEVDAAVTTFTAEARTLSISTEQQLVLAHAGRRLPRGSSGATQPPTSPAAARVAWAAAVVSEKHSTQVRDTAYAIFERALITYWYHDTDGATIDVLCDRYGLDRREFRRLAARTAYAMPSIDDHKFDDWCKQANVILKQPPPAPGHTRESATGTLQPGKASKTKRTRTVAGVSASAGEALRASVIHQVKGEEADAVLIVIPDDERTNAIIEAWIGGEHHPDIAENLRVLYVAATRARRLLAFALPTSALDRVHDYLTAHSIPIRKVDA